jgi:predicted GH43/DUF377 family glycosyl hydrolase
MMQSASRNAGPACVCLGRTGDIAAAIPIAHQIYYQTGGTVPFIVSRDYAPILDACSYIHPVIFDGTFTQLVRAIQRYRGRYSQLHVAQMYCTDGVMPEPIKTSFVLDAWNRAGFFDMFGLPLVIDKRNRQREDEVVLPGEPFIALHRGGFSSPYPYRNELMHALRGLRIVDITAAQATAPQDLLGILERASVAILADSFPLHLSFACRDLPVIALQADKPNNWFGSPPRPNWIAKYRYEESKAKVDEIAALAAEQLLAPKRTYFHFPAGAYNASMLGDMFTWRFHPNGGWETRLAGSLANGKQKPILLPKSLDAYSHEDARLFEHNGKTHISYTLSRLDGPERKMRYARSVVGYGELTCGKTSWRVTEHKQVKYGKNDWSDMEKNHVFWSQDGKLYCLYGAVPEQTVLEVEGDTVVAEHKSPTPTWNFGRIRGDVILPYDGKLLRIFHSRIDFPMRKFRYHIGAAYLSATAPFQTLSVTKAPIFSGDEVRPKTLHNSKHNVVFTCGAEITGGDIVLPVSFNDDQTLITRIPIKSLGL